MNGLKIAGYVVATIAVLAVLAAVWIKVRASGILALRSDSSERKRSHLPNVSILTVKDPNEIPCDKVLFGLCCHRSNIAKSVGCGLLRSQVFTLEHGLKRRYR